MSNATARLPRLLAGDTPKLHSWLVEPGWGWSAVCVATILIGSGFYGATLGMWCGPQQAAYTAIKFPLVVFLTCGANAALNGCVGQLLGSGLGFRQTTLAILMGFAVTSIALAAFVPVVLFLLWNLPAYAPSGAMPSQRIVLLAHVAVIALAGIAGARRLFRLVARTSGSVAVARQIFFGWLVGNLLLGAQITWVLRPFIVTPRPGLEVEFLRLHPLQGSFFDSVWLTLRHLF